MHNVRVGQVGLTNEKVAEVLGRLLGDGTSAQARGFDTIEVRKGTFKRAKIQMQQEGGATLFTVRGQGLPIPLLIFTLMYVNDRGFAKRVADTLEHADWAPSGA